jgi:ubiquinol-cytochrome c reductase cytochrome c1 subunit
MMFRKIAISALSALILATGAVRAEEGAETTDVAFSFEGPFGTFDAHQLQRGLQVYTEVCSACHGLKLLRIGSLAEPGGLDLTEEMVKAYAKGLTVTDAVTGEDREATPADHFPANTGAGAPDLSVMAKARKGFSGPYGLGTNQLFKGMGGPEHIYSIITGFTGETKDLAGVTLYENKAFPGGWMAMPNEAVLADAVVYADGTEASLDQEAKDVAAFLMWAAEPRMMVRKESGLKAVIILGLLTVLLYLSNKALWANVKGKKKHA